MKPVDFLELVWGERQGYVDLPAKVVPEDGGPGRWVSGVLAWPANGAASERVRTAVRDQEDIYFSVAQFSKPRREAESVLNTPWLWADLDHVTPERCADIGLAPTICWTSSPGRYQALWRLSKTLSPQIQEKLNRKLTYVLGADKGGWDLTQVLRVPGSRNFKYEGAPRVKLVTRDGPTYDPKKLYKKLNKLRPLTTRAEGAGVRNRLAPQRRSRGPRPTISPRAKRLLQTPTDQVVMGERSARLWELECLLLEAGHNEDEVFDLIQPCAWNKWRDVRTGDRRLKREISKAASHVRGKIDTPSLDRHETPKAEAFTVLEPDEKSTLPLVSYADFMAKNLEAPRWLIEEIWTAGSHGIIGGEPKTSKSTIALALALSVASGKSWLGEYDVGVTGPAIVVQEENAEWQVQDRLRKLAHYYGLIRAQDVSEKRAPKGALGRRVVSLDMPDDVPLFLLNHWGYDMSLEEHREALETAIDEIRPVLVVLDPLYLMLGTAEEERSAHLRPFLKWLLYLRYEYNCAIPVVHHFRKAREGITTRPGQRILGSATLHGWVDSALYCQALDPPSQNETRTRIEREFRNVGPRRPFDVSLRFGNPGDLRLTADVSQWDATGEIVALVNESPGITITAAAEALGLEKRTALTRARGSGKIRLEGGKRGRGHTWKLFPIDHEEDDK